MMLFHMSADEFAAVQSLKREGLDSVDVARALNTGDHRLEWETNLLSVERPSPERATNHNHLFWAAIRMI